MNTYEVQYTEDIGATYKTIIVKASDYTKAYFEASFILSLTAMITRICLI